MGESELDNLFKGFEEDNSEELRIKRTRSYKRSNLSHQKKTEVADSESSINIADLFEGCQDDTEVLNRARLEQYLAESKIKPVQKPILKPRLTRSVRNTARDLEKLFFELEANDPGIKFGQDAVRTMNWCKELAEVYSIHGYDNLLRLKVRRAFCDKKIFYTLQLKPEYGNIPQMTFANLTFQKYNPTRRFRGEPLILPTKRGNFLIPRKRVERVVSEMLTLVKTKAQEQSFRIQDINYFSQFQTRNHRAFMRGTYYCSKREEFVLE